MYSKSSEPPKESLFIRISSSITVRLAFLYLLSAVVTLAFVVTYVHWLQHNAVLDTQNDFINARLGVFRTLLPDHPHHLDVIANNIEWEGANAKHPEYYVRIVDPEGRVLIETPGMGSVLPPKLFACPNIDRPNDITTNTRGGRYYLLRCDAGKEATVPGGRLIIQMGLDITDAENILKKTHRQLIALIIIGLVVATGVGIAVARKTLSPLQEITGMAEQITVEKIGSRLDPLTWPTELRAFAVAFNGMLGRLDDSFTRLSRSVSNLAHELRTPINNLRGEAEVALSRERNADEYRQVIESNVEEYQRISRMVDDILYLARTENPSLHVDRLLFDPIAVMKQLCGYFESLVDDKGAAISFQGGGRLYGNPEMFKRVINNLVTNALNYSPVGVTIDISVRQADDGYLDVSVSDTGYGIEPHEQARIFDRFYRGERYRANHPEGTGLGLPIVRTIMDLHGGTVSLKSTPGMGSTFLLRFPSPPPL